MQLSKKVTCSFAALLFIVSCILSVPAVAQTSCEYSSLDSDDNNSVERSEFNTALNDMEVYSSWEEEGLLVEEEWDKGFQEYYSGYDNRLFGDFSDWDLNEDGQISEDEFEESLFGMVDSNDDEVITSEEWNRYSKYICN